MANIFFFFVLLFPCFSFSAEMGKTQDRQSGLLYRDDGLNNIIIFANDFEGKYFEAALGEFMDARTRDANEHGKNVVVKYSLDDDEKAKVLNALGFLLQSSDELFAVGKKVLGTKDKS